MGCSQIIQTARAMGKPLGGTMTDHDLPFQVTTSNGTVTISLNNALSMDAYEKEWGEVVRAAYPEKRIVIEPRRIDLNSVAWENRPVLDGGATCVIVDFGDYIIKAGFIMDEEVDRQRLFAERGLALPVFGFNPSTPIPHKLTEMICPIHGNDMDEESWNCHCGEHMSLLAMPKAFPLTEQERRERKDEIQSLLGQVKAVVRESKDRFYIETIDRHVMKDKDGRLMFIDFGDPNELESW